jgi:hypothetical protein
MKKTVIMGSRFIDIPSFPIQINGRSLSLRGDGVQRAPSSVIARSLRPKEPASIQCAERRRNDDICVPIDTLSLIKDS